MDSCARALENEKVIWKYHTTFSTALKDALTLNAPRATAQRNAPDASEPFVCDGR